MVTLPTPSAFPACLIDARLEGNPWTRERRKRYKQKSNLITRSRVLASCFFPFGIYLPSEVSRCINQQTRLSVDHQAAQKSRSIAPNDLASDDHPRLVKQVSIARRLVGDQEGVLFQNERT